MSFPHYDEYENSGVAWLGYLPAHWPTKPLRALARQEQNAFTDGDWIESPYITDAGVRLIQTGNIGVGTYREKGYRYVSLETFGKMRCTELHAGDILICRLAEPVGRACLAPNLRTKMITSVDVCILKTKNEVDARFVNYFFASSAYLGHLESVSRGGTWMRVSRSFLGGVRIPLPEKAEQSGIATFLDHETAKIDALVAEQKRLIELLKEKRQAVISHAVTKGLDPNVPMKGSRVEWLGNVPAHWLVGSLRWYAEIQGGIAKGKDHAGKDVIELPYLRVANVQNGYVDLSDVAEIAVLPHEADRYALRAGDVLMNEGGDNDKLGRGAVWRAEVEPCLHQNHVFAIRPNSHLLAEWLALFTSAEAARTYFYLHSKQSTNLASISSSNVMNCPIPLPGVGEQREILDSIERQAAAIDEMTAEAKKSSGLLAERRSALISAAVTGKIDVRDWEPPRSAEKTSREEAMETT